jgi:tetratricopeptide (TPR) repeat protein
MQLEDEHGAEMHDPGERSGRIGRAEGAAAEACSHRPPEPDEAGIAGSSVHGYSIVARLGWRRAGVAYEAILDESGRRVVLLLLPTPLDAAERIARFRRESERLVHLRHPHLREVIATGVWHRPGGAHPYLVVSGEFAETLPEHLARRRPDAAAIVRLLAEACEALSYAHAHGVDHGDLGAADVLVGLDGRALLADVGVTRLLRTLAHSPAGSWPARVDLPRSGLEPAETFRDTLAIGEIARSTLLWGDEAGRTSAPALASAGSGSEGVARVLAATPWAQHGGPSGVAAALRAAVGGRAGGIDPPKPLKARRGRAIRTAGLCLATGWACLFLGLAIGHLGRGGSVQAPVSIGAAAANGEAVASRSGVETFLERNLPAAMLMAGLDGDSTLAELLDLVAAGLQSWERPPLSAEAAGSAHLALAGAFSAIGADERAIDGLRTAIDRLASAPAARRLEAESRLGTALLQMRRLDEALAALGPAAEQAASRLGKGNSIARRLAHDLAVARFLRDGDSGRAIAALEAIPPQAPSGEPELLPPGERASTLAAILESVGRVEEAERLLAASIADPAPPIEIASRYARLAGVRLALARPDAALAAAERAFSHACAGLGWEHPATAQMASLLAAVAERSGGYRQAAAFAASALAAAPSLSPGVAAVLELRRLQAWSLARAGDLAGAEEAVRSLLADLERSAGRDHPLTLSVLGSMAALRLEATDAHAAAELLAEGVRRRLASRSADRVDLLRSVQEFSAALARSDRPRELLRLAEAISSEVNLAAGDAHPASLAARRAEAAILREEGRLDEAVGILEEIAARAIASLPEDDPLPVHCRNDLAHALLLRGDLAASDRVLRDAWARAAGRGPAFEPASRQIGQLARELVRRLRRIDAAEAEEPISFWRERIAGTAG